jgi:hypothetical protein
MNPFQSLRDYELYVYTLQQHFPVIQSSTLVIVPRGQRVAILQGEIIFPKPNLPALIAEIEILIQEKV